MKFSGASRAMTSASWTVTRPALRYHGGKWRIAPWLLQFFPQHRTYVEPFGGGGSVLLRKARSYAEVYNDLDAEVVNVFAILRDRGDELRRLLALTPFSRVEFALSYKPTEDRVEQARRTIARSFMGFGSAAATGENSGFRANSNRSGTTPAHDWANYADALPALTERLRGVVIEQRDALDCMAHHDSPDTLHYCDPPYVHSTRSSKVRGVKSKGRASGKAYNHEMTDEEHQRFAEFVHGLEGMCIVSGYPCELYDDLFGDWERHERPAYADGARVRTEVVWLNQACSAALERSRGGLFAEVV